MIVAQSYSELSQTTAMNLSRNQSTIFYSLTISTKARLQMLNYPQKAPLIICNTS